MQDIVFPRLFYGPRQPQARQQLVTPPIDRGYPLERGAINKSHARARRVYAARLYLALPSPPLQLFEIERGRRRLATQDRAPLAMDDLLDRVLTVNLVVDLLVVVRRQGDADLLVLADDGRPRPDYIAQLQNRRFGPFRQCALDRRPSHLQIRRTWQRLLTGMAVGRRLMIGEEELFSRKGRTIALLAQIRGVAVQQGVQDRCRRARRLHTDDFGRFSRCRIDPVALFGERVRGKADASRFDLAIQLVPIRLQPLDPQLQQLGEILPGDQLVNNGFLQVIILADDAQALLAAFYLSLIRVFDTLLAGHIGLEFFSQSLDRRRQEAHPFIHHRSSHLQRIRHLRQIDGLRLLTNEAQKITGFLPQLLRRSG